MEGRVRNHPSGAIGAYRQGLSTPTKGGPMVAAIIGHG
jgi:hypothetical protein